MAQRIRSCTNSTNFETINCASYGSRLGKREKSITTKLGNSQKSLRDPSAVNLRTPIAPVTTSSTIKCRPGIMRQYNVKPSKAPPTPPNVHKKVLADNSELVAVTVRTCKNQRPCTGDSNSNDEQPWGTRLKSTKSTEILSSFSNFDPIRTLHFLAKELRSKLKIVAPCDPTLLQMVADMEHALNRIPHEISSTICLAKELESLPLTEITSKIIAKNGNENQQNEYPVGKYHSDKGVQTIGNTLEMEIFYKQLEENADKLEAAYKTMETLCNRLKSEKDEVNLLLFAEKDTVKFLRKQIEQLETEKAETRNAAYEKLAEERDSLQMQVKRLKAKIEPQENTFSELKSTVKSLQKENAKIAHDNLGLRHKLTLYSMEKEKYVTILNVRDRQINEIRAEMNQLQEVITEQLSELHRSSPSSQSSTVGLYR